MLARFAKVNPDGTFIEPANAALAYMTLISERLGWVFFALLHSWQWFNLFSLKVLLEWRLIVSHKRSL